jgi:hypothetical protein
MFGLGEGNVMAGTGMPAGGITSYDDWNQFAKAVATSGYDTDHASLEGTQALRVESLEGQLRKVIEQEPTFKLFRALKRNPVTSAVHEWTVQTDIGGQPEGAFNSEIGSIGSNVGAYERRIVFIKYLMTQAAISHVASVQRGIVNLKATENQNALLRLSRSANWAMYHGDSAVSPMQFDGLAAQLTAFRNGKHVRDLAGSSDAQAVIDGVYAAYAEVIGLGNFGRLTHIHMDPQAQNALDRELDPAYRVNMDANPANLTYGAPVTGIRTSYGTVVTEQDIWINNSDNTMPNYARYAKVPDDAPGAPTLAILVSVGTTAGSQFTAAKGGGKTFFYRVCAIDNRGVESLPTAASSAAAVTAGHSVALTITPNADYKQTGYAIYRTKALAGGSPAPDLAEYRLVKRVAANATASADTAYTDLNTDVPGASNLFLINRVPQSIGWAQLLPATQFPLYPTNSAIIPWAVLLYGALQLSIPNHHFMLKNFVPATAQWKPW